MTATTVSSLLALLILVQQYVHGDAAARKRIHQIYLRNSRSVNNWDLVDSSAAQLTSTT